MDLFGGLFCSSFSLFYTGKGAQNISTEFLKDKPALALGFHTDGKETFSSWFHVTEGLSHAVSKKRFKHRELPKSSEAFSLLKYPLPYAECPLWKPGSFLPASGIDFQRGGAGSAVGMGRARLRSCRFLPLTTQKISSRRESHLTCKCWYQRCFSFSSSLCGWVLKKIL